MWRWHPASGGGGGGSRSLIHARICSLIRSLSASLGTVTGRPGGGGSLGNSAMKVTMNCGCFQSEGPTVHLLWATGHTRKALGAEWKPQQPLHKARTTSSQETSSSSDSTGPHGGPCYSLTRHTSASHGFARVWGSRQVSPRAHGSRLGQASAFRLGTCHRRSGWRWGWRALGVCRGCSCPPALSTRLPPASLHPGRGWGAALSAAEAAGPPPCRLKALDSRSLRAQD